MARSCPLVHGGWAQHAGQVQNGEPTGNVKIVPHQAREIKQMARSTKRRREGASPTRAPHALNARASLPDDAWLLVLQHLEAQEW